MIKIELEEVLNIKDSGLTTRELINLLLKEDTNNWITEFERSGKSG